MRSGSSAIDGDCRRCIGADAFAINRKLTAFDGVVYLLRTNAETVGRTLRRACDGKQWRAALARHNARSNKCSGGLD